MFSASGTARARSFCTHGRSRTTESTVFQHIHHTDRRPLQLFQRLALRGRASLAAVSFSRHIRLASFCAFVLLCFCAEPQTSREVDQDPEVGLTRQCNGTLCVRLYSFRFTLFVTRRRWRVMPRLPEEPEELFVPGQALSLLMF